MCGIVAEFAYGPNAPVVSREAVLKAREAMASRGPDGAGYWESADRRVALGHRRLSIIDVSERANQPFASADEELHIVFNGEIYNHRELRGKLEAHGHAFRTTSDTEVLLALWRESGPSMVDALQGMYAFALWDAKSRMLFAARDPLGIKPLYLADDGATLRLASQVKALLAGGGVDTSPDPAGHVGFFVWGAVPEPFTLYRGISAVPAGATLEVAERDRPVIRRKEFVRESLADLSRDAAMVPVADALRESVRRHLVSDVPVGLFLSSGIDSATLGALAREDGWKGQALTLGFDELRGRRADETGLSGRVALHLASPHVVARVQRDDFTRSLERLFAAMDQPTTDGVNTWLVSQAARREGWKVALSGMGGDELFGGYPSFRQVPRMAALLGAFGSHSGVGQAARRLLGPFVSRLTSPKYASLLEYGGSLAGAYLLRRALFLPWELTGLLDGDVLREGWLRLETLDRLEDSIRGIGSPHAAVAALEATWYMRNQLLRDADWAGMAYSLEIRVPFVDATLFSAVAPALAGSTPPRKSDLFAAPHQALPTGVLHRRKTGFETPVREWEESTERGLRGWARRVHREVGGLAAEACLLRKRAA